MTKKKKYAKKNRKGFVAIPFETAVNLSTLANDDVLSVASMASFGEDIYIISVDCLFSIRGLTALEGPLQFGFAHSDLTDTEIKEALEAELTDPDDIIAKERARRPVRRAGQFSGLNTDDIFNDGRVKRVKIKFSVGDGFTLDAWIKNRSGSALTTGANVGVTGTLYGRWQR